MAIRLADALDHIHSVGILHHDIKPRNIGFARADLPKLLDFGLAQLLHDRRPSSGPVDRSSKGPDLGQTEQDRTAGGDLPVLAGTPGYMSPEAIRGGYADASFDLWALAIVLYEAITSFNPMAKPTVGETLRQVMAARVPDIRNKVPTCPVSVAEFLSAALSSDIRKRPKNARDFRSRLESLHLRD
jgi:serine/threonine protein kinase